MRDGTMMRITFLGTVAARPTPNRNVSSLLVQREGELMMFDCGEGTQRQMMRYGTGFGLRDIFFSHLHADHYLGTIGLLQTMALHNRRDPLHLWAPCGMEPLLEQAIALGGARLPFEVVIRGLAAGDALIRDGYDIVCCGTRHRGQSLGFALVEHPRPGRFLVARARALRIPEGPLWGRLQKGETVQVSGRTIGPEDVVGPPRPGRKVLYTGDTRPCSSVRAAASSADVLIHEATFGSDEADRARSTGHSTAAEAAEVARAAGVRSLILTHVSARYAEAPRVLEKEAALVFPNSRVARDGLTIEVPFAEEAASPSQTEEPCEP